VRARERSEANLKVFRKRAELAPRSGEAWYALGRAYALAGRQREAEDALRAALRVEPTHAAARRLLGTLGSARPMPTPYDSGP
jgi:cytochrome c-type biogenesis protein CcmH/NrfG